MVTLTGPAAALDRALVEAVGAARAQDDERLGRALEQLHRADPTHLRRVLTAAVRPALEARHPDGVTGDDLMIVLRTVDGADPTALAVVLTGAFGVGLTAGELNSASEGEDDDAAPQLVSAAEIDRAAVLLLAHLTATTRDLRRLLDAAWAEIARADHQD